MKINHLRPVKSVSLLAAWWLISINCFRLRNQEGVAHDPAGHNE